MLFRVLGPVDVVAGERPTAVGRGHQRTILALLVAARGEVVPTETLIDGVWPHDPPATARKSLQSHVSRLRGRLDGLTSGDPPALLSAPDGYRLDLEHHGLDADEFVTLVGRARDELHGSPADAIGPLDRSLAMWRGRAFGQLAEHPAIRPEAVRLEELRRAAAADRVEALLALGEHERATGELESMVAEDPLAERPHGQLMAALYASGRQRDALEVFHGLRERLRDELGIDPSPGLRELHERILRQEAPRHPPAPGAIVDLPDAESSSGRGRAGDHLVAPGLVGRDAEVPELARLVEPGRLVTLTGPGGVGKTRLAEQVAAGVAEWFADGVASIALAAVREPDSVGEAMVTALGIQPTGEIATRDTLIRALGEREMLLMLDNCEHVVEAVAPLVEAIRSHCPRVAVLATSRERLRVADERLWPVAPLAVPPRGAGPREVEATPAGELFRRRAEAVEPSFSLTDDNAPTVAELCRRLDGMPLAIELAAARVRAMTPGDLVARLDQRFTLLAAGPRHEAGRHRTLQAVVAWSYDLLGPAEAALFDRLSVFSGSFRLDAAERVCAADGVDASEVAGLVGELVDKSMVVADRRGDGVRYRLLDTLREFGARRLAERSETARWRRSHARYHVALAEELGPLVRGPQEPAAVADIGAAFDDLRSAHTWLVGRDDVDGALRIPAALGDYLFYRLRDEVTTWARRATALPGAEDDPSYAAALATAALGATSRAECDRARQEAEEALAHDEPDGLATCWAIAALGAAALYEGELDELLVHADQLAAVTERRAEAFHRGFAWVLRVMAHIYRDEPDAARAALRELDEAAEESRSPSMIAFARYNRGEALLDAEPRAAADALEEAVRVARKVDNALVEGVSMVSLASSRARLGESDLALRQFRDVVAHWRRLGDRTHQLTTLRNLVVLLAEIGADEQAAELHGAVTGGLTPSFGAEERRLASAWDQLEERLGPDAAAAAADRGRGLTATRMGEVALRHIDGLLEERPGPTA